MVWKATMLKKYLLLMMLCLIVSGQTKASSASKAQKALDANLISYQLAIRWNDFEAAIGSLDPTIIREEGYSENIEAQFKNYQITGYTLKSATWPDALSYMQRVEIRYIEINTQIEKTVVDKQSWRYDAVAKRWWLISDLPKLE
jgi:outer membrane lipoprotein-sorting protein